YAARHPEHARALRELFPALRLLGAMSGSGAPDQGPAAAAPPAPEVRTLGDFRILREVGRGGMGVVYEAEQLSLGRRVALKVLPSAGLLDPRQLQRFQNEARAAAGLHHTNIVPVHYVGCESGVHFYAMQFIDGRNLADLLPQLRRLAAEKPAGTLPAAPAAAEGGRTGPYEGSAEGPAPPDNTTGPGAGRDTLLTSGPGRGKDYFRRVAGLGAQAAEALDYAHGLGVVHRDIKPAHLLLDAAGPLWVTGFGLAQVQHAAASLTRT